MQNVHKNKLKTKRIVWKKALNLKKLMETDIQYFDLKCLFHRFPILARWTAKTKTLQLLRNKETITLKRLLESIGYMCTFQW